jgi:hypothetical protein
LAWIFSGEKYNGFHDEAAQQKGRNRLPTIHVHGSADVN